MPLPTVASLTAAGAAVTAPSMDEDALTTFLTDLRGRVEALQNVLLNGGTVVTSTTVALVAIGNAINTAAKSATKIVYNSTDGKFYKAAGSAAADVWVVVAPDTGTSITPA